MGHRIPVPWPFIMTVQGGSGSARCSRPREAGLTGFLIQAKPAQFTEGGSRAASNNTLRRMPVLLSRARKGKGREGVGRWHAERTTDGRHSALQAKGNPPMSQHGWSPLVLKEYLLARSLSQEKIWGKWLGARNRSLGLSRTG